MKVKIFLNLFYQKKAFTLESMKYTCKEIQEETSLVAQWLRICLPVQGMQVQYLVGELRSYVLWGN